MCTIRMLGENDWWAIDSRYRFSWRQSAAR
jgi:hypothetical protein